MINVINHYNDSCSEEALSLMTSKEKVIIRENQSEFSYNFNNKEPFGTWNGSVLEIKNDFPDWENGAKYSPFDILSKYRFKGNPIQTMMHLLKRFEPKKIPFIRVGCDYFKVKEHTDDNGNVTQRKLIPFIKTEIKEDYGSDAIEYLQKYDEFCIEPNNLEYKQVVNGCYNNFQNTYNHAKEFDYNLEPEKIEWSLKMMKHIFGEQYEMGMDYMKLLWEKPKQILPILTLASELRQTGKTTFADWINKIHKTNYISIGVSDMKGEFNPHIAEKLIVAIEETVSESHSLVNKIKMMSTAKTMLINKKNISQYTVDFYGKIIVLTNKPDKFLQIDEEEIRFWVRNVPKIEGENHNILEDLTREIPYFLHYLSLRDDVDTSKSRMVFTPEELGTKALKVVQKESKSALQKDFEMYLDDYCVMHPFEEEICFTALDIKEVFFNKDNSIHASRVRRMLKEMRIEQYGRNGRYTKIGSDSVTNTKGGNGNYYIVPNKYFQSSNGVHEMDTDSIPF